MRTKTTTTDRTARWVIFKRMNHKDGGYFWGLSGFADASYPSEALTDFLAANPGWQAEKYAVLDWQAAQMFSNTPAVTQD